MSLLRQIGSKFHYIASALLAILLLPLMEKCGLPFHYNWRLFCLSYLYFGAQGAFLAILIYVSAKLSNLGANALLEDLRKNSLRLITSALYVVTLKLVFTWPQAIVFGVDTMFVVKLISRPDRKQSGRAAIYLLGPALYFLAGLILISSYNDIIAFHGDFSAYDQAFNSLDRSLLRGLSVSVLAQRAAASLPYYFFRGLEFIYYGLFPLVAATFFLSGSLGGRQRAMQFVGAVLTAYYVSLLVYYLAPSMGPFYLNAKFGAFPPRLGTYALQRQLIERVQALSHHRAIGGVSFDYLIAFPCMHITQSLLVLWFLRDRKRLFIFLSAYNALLVVAIILLRWHYFVDIIGGIAVAAISIVAVEAGSLPT